MNKEKKGTKWDKRKIKRTTERKWINKRMKRSEEKE